MSARNAETAFFVGCIDNIKRSERPPKYEVVTLVKPRNDDYYDWYVESYRDFHATNPNLKDWVPVNDKAEMEECRSRDLLHIVHINGLRAGLIAGNSHPLLGRCGLYFVEIMMTQTFKGHGWAPVAQRKFIDMLPPEHEVVWGTIDAQNLPSTKSALRVGRRSMREEFFIKI